MMAQSHRGRAETGKWKEETLWYRIHSVRRIKIVGEVWDLAGCRQANEREMKGT